MCRKDARKATMIPRRSRVAGRSKGGVYGAGSPTVDVRTARRRAGNRRACRYQVNKDTQADKAFAKYGTTGLGVIIAIIDRGIDYTHPDFRNADGTTRIKMMWDMSGQSGCDSSNPPPVIYTEAQINAALATGGTPLAERDAVGHGTVTAGIAAGNGSAVGKASAQYAGIAPGADLLIVKATSEGAPAHGNQPAEAAFSGCLNQALDLVTQEAATLGEPIVGLINSGTQWGPIDGTGTVSREIDLDFGLDRPGRIYTEASGDEGAYENHARSTYSSTAATVFPFKLSSVSTEYFQIWYSGAVAANVTIKTNDDGDSLTSVANSCVVSSDGSIEMCSYLPGQQAWPWTSSGPDYAVWVYINGHGGTGSVAIKATQAGTGTVDVYGDSGGVMAYTKFLTAGRLNDYSSTYSALVAGCYNVRTKWTDINGLAESLTDQAGIVSFSGFLPVHASNRLRHQCANHNQRRSCSIRRDGRGQRRTEGRQQKQRRHEDILLSPVRAPAATPAALSM